MSERKPLIVLGLLGLLAIALFVTGAVGAGRGDRDAWPDWAAPDVSPGAALTTSDLTGSSSCGFDQATISFAGTCRVTVRELTEGWPWQAVTRRALLVAGAEPVELAVTLVGRDLRMDLDPRDAVRLTYPREGGTFVLGCGEPLGCTVLLAEDA